MVGISLFVEGGGKSLHRACRSGFGAFFEKAGVETNTLNIVACGGRGDAYNDFKSAPPNGPLPILLVDAEGSVTSKSAWAHLRTSDHWTRPKGAADDQCHLMVQAMESWFLADADALASHYGQGFQKQRLPQNPSIEEVSKTDVVDGLQRAATNTGRSGYNKGRDSFAILAQLDPGKVMAASPHAKRLVEALGG